MYLERRQAISPWQRFWQWFTRVLRETDPTFAEFQTGFLALLWGLWLLNPHWFVFDTSPSFRAMEQVAPEWQWGGAITAVALIHVCGIAWHSLRLRSVAAALVCLLWIFIAAPIIYANPRSTATIIYPWLAFTAAWTYWRLTLERARLTQRDKRSS